MNKNVFSIKFICWLVFIEAYSPRLGHDVAFY